MNPTPQHCQREERREAVRHTEKLNGLDYLEVSEDQRSLTVYFLGKISPHFDTRTVVIEGGVQVKVRVKSVDVQTQGERDQDDTMVVTVNRRGDGSRYTLRIAQLDKHGNPTGHPPANFDPRYDRIAFTFKEGCPSDLDCAGDPAPCGCSQTGAAPSNPDFNYLARDYSGLRQLLLDRLSVTIPDWTERKVPDMGIALVEVLAYLGDHLSYYQDAVGTEAYLGTARRRISVRRHARLLDYQLSEGDNTRAFVQIDASGDFDLPLEPAAFATDSATPVVFEPVNRGTLKLYSAHNEICIYTWKDSLCYLPCGSTSATLYSKSALHLHKGDLLLFEEVKGADTGLPEDRDLRKRHVVRLTGCRKAKDPVDGTPVYEVIWSDADALPFDLCVSLLSPADCSLVSCVSVARGNVLLVDQGQSTSEELGTVDTVAGAGGCEDVGVRKEAILSAAAFSARLSGEPLTFRQPPPASAPASLTLTQDPSKALPQIVVLEKAVDGSQQTWEPQPDLLSSSPTDRHFVVETDDDGYAHLRFGDGALGRMPAAGSVMTARYRVGNGRAGLVGAESIVKLTLEKTSIGGLTLTPRNPLPAAGGDEPEPVSSARFNAPRLSLRPIERAVIPADYATLAQRDPRVERAAATAQHTGVNDEIHVAIDALGHAPTPAELCTEIRACLEPYRRMGHDVVVVPAQYVPFRVSVKVCAQPQALAAHVKRGVIDALGPKGLFAPDRLTFGQSIEASRIYAAAQAVPGVASVKVTQLMRVFEDPGGGIDQGVLVIGPLEIARLDQDPAYPDNGFVDVTVGGGR